MRGLPFRQPASQRVLVKFTGDDEMERYEGKEREEGISSVVKKPFRCLVGMKPSLDRDHGDGFAYDQYVPPVGSFDDEFGFEAIEDFNKKPKKSSPRKKETKEKQAVELKEASPTSVTHPFEDVSSPFRCLVGMKPSLHGDYEGGAPAGSYGYEYDFETMDNEKPKKSSPPKETKEKQAVALKKSSPTSVSHPFEDFPNLSMFRNRSFTKNRSFEKDLPHLDAIPQFVPERNHSFVDAIPTPTKADPLDSASIRDVQKALREMERKLKAADTEGKRISRSKVMKALLTVVDQLDEEYDYGAGLNMIGGSRPSSSLSSERPLSPEVTSRPTSPRSNISSGPKSPRNNLVNGIHKSPGNNGSNSGRKSHKKASVEELYRQWTGPSFGDTEQHVEATPKQESQARSPSLQASVFDFDKMPSPFTQMNEVKGAPNAETKEVEYISSSDESESASDSDQEETIFSGEDTTRLSREETTLSSEKTRETKTTKGSFAHAVSPPRRTEKKSVAPRRKEKTSSGFDDFFNLDMNDPIVRAGVKDALRDLMWIPTSPDIEESKKEPVSSKPPVGQPSLSAPKKHVLDKLQKERGAWYEQEGDDDDVEKHEAYEESTAATTKTFTPPRETIRDRSWWRRNRTLKPSSKDTYNVHKPTEHETMKVTVTSSDHWKDVLY